MCQMCAKCARFKSLNKDKKKISDLKLTEKSTRHFAQKSIAVQPNGTYLKKYRGTGTKKVPRYRYEKSTAILLYSVLPTSA